MIDLEVVIESALDSATKERWRENDSVPWEHYERQVRWRESLQRELDAAFDAPRGWLGQLWPQSGDQAAEGWEAMHALVERLQGLHTEIARAEAQRDAVLDKARALEAEAVDLESTRVAGELGVELAIDPQELRLEPYMRRCEAHAIRLALRSTGNDKGKAAAALGVGRSTLYRRMQALEISVD